MTRERMEEIIFAARLLELNCRWYAAVGPYQFSETAQRDRQWLVTKLFALVGLEGR